MMMMMMIKIIILSTFSLVMAQEVNPVRIGDIQLAVTILANIGKVNADAKPMPTSVKVSKNLKAARLATKKRVASTWRKRKYICEICKYGTDQPADLVKHNNTAKHRTTTGLPQVAWYLRAYTCATCKYGTDVFSHLIQHNHSTAHRAATGLPQVAWYLREYMCKTCEYGTDRRERFTSHNNSAKHRTAAERVAPIDLQTLRAQQ